MMEGPDFDYKFGCIHRRHNNIFKLLQTAGAVRQEFDTFFKLQYLALEFGLLALGLSFSFAQLHILRQQL